MKPNELQLETPYLQRNISLTQEAYNLRQITVKPFPAEQGLTLQSLQDNRATIDNIRLWDWQPLIDTYAQLQEIRTYYKFLDVDVDRYELGGSYQQVMLSARELEVARLPPNAQTWVNQHLLFTHGNGVVMSPVTQKSAEGLPIFYLHDIPPIASGGPPLNEPRIYFGESPDSYVIVKGSMREFDYPKGADNAYTTYDGADGVALGEIAKNLSSPGISTTQTSCSPATLRVRAAFFSVETSPIAFKRSPRFSVSTMTPMRSSATVGSFGSRMLTQPAAGSPMPSRSAEKA